MLLFDLLTQSTSRIPLYIITVKENKNSNTDIFL